MNLQVGNEQDYETSAASKTITTKAKQHNTQQITPKFLYKTGRSLMTWKKFIKNKLSPHPMMSLLINASYISLNRMLKRVFPDDNINFTTSSNIT